MDYLFWVLYHLHKRDNKKWSTFLTCSAMTLFIFVYLFLLAQIFSVLFKENLILKIENNVKNDEMLIFSIYVIINAILYFFYQKRSIIVLNKNEESPTYKDYVIVLLFFVLPIILNQFIL